jgi:squalene-hopene/tetraprenyl-beta-curcumene cyclase
MSRVKSQDRYSESIKKGTEFILKMQNRDGGWAAFSKNNNGNFLLRKFAKKFEDSADLFDESSADVTGHVLEALGIVGLTVENSKAVRRAVKYLIKTSENGIWKGRWGVNYIYGTSAVVVGLLKVGIRTDDPLIKNAMTWIKSKQNKDGGWGETTASDKNPNLAGIGMSTPSQTSWALLALLGANREHFSSVRKGIEYLSKSYKEGTGWTDPSAVGTGHPSLLYMVYPSYPKAFPIMAIARYLEIKKTKE